MSWNQPSWNQSSTKEPAFMPVDVRDERVGAFLSRVYGWMFLGLLITSGTALAVASTPAIIENLRLNRLLFLGLLFAQLGLVFYLAARVDKVSPATAAGLFVLYSALVGVTSSVISLDVHYYRRDVWRHSVLWNSYQKKSRRPRSVFLHGFDRTHPRYDRGSILA